MGFAPRSPRLQVREPTGRARPSAHDAGPLSGLGRTRASGIERWFAAQGPPAHFDLARSGAPARSVADLLAIAEPEDVEEYLGMSLDYGDGIGSERLRNSIAAMLGCDASDVVVTHGAAEALLLACSSVPGDRRHFAVASPAYEGLLRAVEAAGGIARRVRVWRPGTRHLDISALAELELSRYAAIVLNTPHNPTGLQVALSELDSLAERCAEHGTALILDQVSLRTLDPEAQPAPLSLQDCSMLVVGDVSKAYGLGGLRIGWCASKRPEWLSRIAELHDLTSISNSRPAQLLAAIAVENRDRLPVSPVARSNLERMDRWITSVAGALPLRPSDGLVVFCGLPLPSPSVSFAEMLRARHGVSVTPGSFFGHDRHLRIGLGVREEEFAEGLGRLAVALEHEQVGPASRLETGN